MSSEKYEKVNHPQHYNAHPSGVECIDIIEHFNLNIGSAIKYAWRAGLKPGEETEEDLRKAHWYLTRELERIGKAKRVDVVRRCPGVIAGAACSSCGGTVEHWPGCTRGMDPSVAPGKPCS